MKSKVAGIASAAAVVVAILSVALGSTFARAGKQDVVDTAVAAGQFKTLAAALNAAGLVKTLKVVVDTNGLPVQLALTAGEAHDNRLAGKLLSRLKPGTMLLADRG
jgi:hypothetical protein